MGNARHDGRDATLAINAVADRIAAHLQRGLVPRSVLETALLAVSADAAERADVLSALANAAILVVEDGYVPPPSASVETTRQTPSEPLTAGRRRLSLDRLLPPSRRHRVLLTAEEEVGLTLLARPTGAPLEPGGFKVLEGEAREAADAMFLHNLRLAHSLARAYAGHGLEHDDLYQSALSGLIRAVELFDPFSGHKFSTYGTWWLRQAITRAIANESRAIRLPVYLWELVRKVSATRDRLTVDGRPPPLTDVAAACAVDVEKVIECLRLAPAVLSLETPLGADQFTLGDLIATKSDCPDHVEIGGLHLEDVEPLLLELREREAAVLRMRFGFTPYDDCHTLDQIGQVYGVTRERIRQIEAEALKNLRAILGRSGLKFTAPGSESKSNGPPTTADPDINLAASA
jgi:RNA polymerase primary sigma factor